MTRISIAGAPFSAFAGVIMAAAATPAWAAADDSLAAIRSEIMKLREDYEARIKNLEDQLKKAEEQAAAAQTAPAPSGTGRLKQCVTRGVFGQGMQFEDMCRMAADLDRGLATQAADLDEFEQLRLRGGGDRTIAG